MLVPEDCNVQRYRAGSCLVDVRVPAEAPSNASGISPYAAISASLHSSHQPVSEKRSWGKRGNVLSEENGKDACKQSARRVLGKVMVVRAVSAGFKVAPRSSSSLKDTT